MEWVRDNIAAFNGDSSQMLLWGQSAGAANVDILNFAYPSDPIVRAFAADSGVATLIASNDFSQSNFTFAANKLGCNETDDAARLACMRLVPQQKIEDFLFNYSVAGTRPSLSFAPIADRKLVFTTAEYNTMRVSGNYSKMVRTYVLVSSNIKNLELKSRIANDPRQQCKRRRLFHDLQRH
jgi:carboxylesterase type B